MPPDNQKMGETSWSRFILYSMLILCGLMLVVLNPLATRLLEPDIKTNADNVIVLLLVSAPFVFLVVLIVTALYLLNRKHPQFSTLMANLSLLVFILLLLLSGSELFFRAFFGHIGVNLYGYNEQFQMLFMKPNLDERLRTSEFDIRFRTNALGLRDTRPLLPRRANERLILVLGDSFIQAAQVDLRETMCHQLEIRLNEKLRLFSEHPEVAVINVAVSGWTPTDERVFLEKNLHFFAPDVVLQFVYVGNDVAETMFEMRALRKASFSKEDQHVVAAKHLKRLALRHSKLFAFVYMRLTERWPMGRPNQPFYHHDFPNGEANVFRRGYSAEIDAAYRRIESEIRRSYDFCRSQAIKFVLFIIPTKEQVDATKLNETLAFLGREADHFDFTKPQREISEFSERNGIPVVDLLESLRTAAMTAPVYFELDSHWNAYGNRVVAAEVATYLSHEYFPATHYDGSH